MSNLFVAQGSIYYPGWQVVEQTAPTAQRVRATFDTEAEAQEFLAELLCHEAGVEDVEQARAELGTIRSDLMYNRRNLSFRESRKALRDAILRVFPDADPGHAAWVASFKRPAVHTNTRAEDIALSQKLFG